MYKLTMDKIEDASTWAAMKGLVLTEIRVHPDVLLDYNSQLHNRTITASAAGDTPSLIRQFTSSFIVSLVPDAAVELEQVQFTLRGGSLPDPSQLLAV